MTFFFYGRSPVWGWLLPVAFPWAAQNQEGPGGRKVIPSTLVLSVSCTATITLNCYSQ